MTPSRSRVRIALLAVCLLLPSSSGGEEPVSAEQLARDPHRPAYHFLPPKNWMNDPNGLIQIKGKYHIFYQHNPSAAVWGNMTWGHAVSEDMVHWKHLPFALHPDQPYDKGGVFSGCMVNDNGVATAVYTGVSPEVQCIATSRDMLKWEKFAGNPVIPGPPPGMKVTGFRDPCVWKQDGVWHMVVGSGIEGKGGTILLYKSKDLRQWDYIGPALVGDKDKTGPMWECPSFFPLGDKWILVISPYRPPIYMIGTFKEDHFTPELQGDVDLGGQFYAPLLFKDERERLIMFGWLQEAREKAEKAGWQGAQSLPRVITLGPDSRPRYAPAPEVNALRGEHARVEHVSVAPDSSGHVPGLRGNTLDLVAEIDPGEAETCGLVVCRSPDGAEQTRIFYDRKQKRLVGDRTKSSTNPAPKKDAPSAPLELAPGEPLRLRVLVDRSVIEVFANERTCLTLRIYPDRPDSTGVDCFATGGPCTVKSLDGWQMKSIWSDAKP